MYFGVFLSATILSNWTKWISFDRETIRHPSALIAKSLFRMKKKQSLIAT